MRRFTVEIIPDLEQGGFTARVPDIPAYVEHFGMADALSRLNQPIALRELDLELENPIRA